VVSIQLPPTLVAALFDELAQQHRSEDAAQPGADHVEARGFVSFGSACQERARAPTPRDWHVRLDIRSVLGIGRAAYHSRLLVASSTEG
jgi:hypothetical protein